MSVPLSTTAGVVEDATVPVLRPWVQVVGARAARPAWGATILFLLVLGGTAIGVLTRNYGPLAAFWPANALLAGALIAFPTLVRWWTVPVAASAYFLADLLLTDDPLLTNLWLSLSNLLSGGVAFLVLAALPAADRSLTRPVSIAGVFGAALGGALVSATVTCWFTGPALGMPVGEAWFRFAGGEFANLLILLPFLLALPLAARDDVETTGQPQVARLGGPVLTVVGLVLMMVLGGPAFLVYPLPGLLLIAATRPVLSTAAFALFSAGVTLVALGESWIDFDHLDATSDLVMSTQVGLALVALGPIAVSVTLARQLELVRTLRHTLAFDNLTGALTRSEFLDRGYRTPAGITVLLLDIDHFKTVNDSYGHATGDAVLARIGDLIRENLHDADLFGRLGGEEFGVVLHAGSRHPRADLAEHLRSRIADTAFDGVAHQVTVSVGVADRRADETFRQALLRADELLYRAKAAGRDQVKSDHTI